MQKKAREIVLKYYNDHAKDKITLNDVYVVWFCKTLQNYKALVSTTVPDGKYYEVTFDGDWHRAYLDVYDLSRNVVVYEKLHQKEKENEDLADTVEDMLSQDYKSRFKAEYWQLVIRFKKLDDLLKAWDKGDLKFTPDSPRGLLNLQIKYMANYISVLEARAVIEGIDLQA